MRLAGLRLGGRVDRYIGSLFVGAYATSLLLIVGLTIILDLAANLSFFETWEDGTQPSSWWVVRYCALNTPFLYLQVAPFVTTTAALFAVVKLIRYNELVACLNAGISARRLLLPVYLGGMVAAAVTFAFREGAITTFGDRRDMLRDMLDEHRFVRRLDDVWLRDIAGNVVRIGEYYTQAREARDVLVASARGETLIALTAASATWSERREGGFGWHLLDGSLREQTGDVSVQSDVEWLELVDFTPQDVLVADKGERRSMDLSFAELEDLSRRDPSNLEYQTLYQTQITFPLANVVLLLVTLPFLFGRERGKNLEGLVIACLICVVYFATDFITRSFGMDGALPPVWAAWIPVLVFGSLGVVLTDSMRS